VVLASRNETALKRITQELNDQGAKAVYVVADVANPDDVAHIAQTARKECSGFDTWINNAGISIFGRLENVSLEDHRRLFETNFWGVVNGSLEAVKHFKAHQRDYTGTIINLGSEVSDVPVPLQGMYSASKHAVKGFTNSLRLELEEEHSNISVTLIKPAAIDTLFVDHAKSYLTVEPNLPPPIYAPEAVADAILNAAQVPRRDVYVGAAAKLFAAGTYYMPRPMDKIMERIMVRLQTTDKVATGNDEDSLHSPSTDNQERHGFPGIVFERSLYTVATNTVQTTFNIAGDILDSVWRSRPGRSR
jgi:short-subunit dehydrogenase